jgi:hypothetical protein
MRSQSFDRFAGLCAILTGIAIFLYAISFVIIDRSNPDLGAKLSALFLLLNGLFATVPMVALYYRFQEVDAPFAMWALLLGIAGALGAAIHGGYDLANAINPPAGVAPEVTNAMLVLPNQVDPRGLLTFGVSGIALFVIAWLMGRSKEFPNTLRMVGYVLAVLLCWLYLGRLIILDPTNLLLVAPVLVAGFIVNPLWYIWLGIVMRRQAAMTPQMSSGARLGMSTKG